MYECNMFAKVVRSGDTVEYYEYSEPIMCGHERPYDVIRRTGEYDSSEKRQDNLYRARQTVRRLIWTNQTKYTKFVTLTYADTVLEVKQVQRDITTFVQRMRRNGYEMRYLYVLEHQKERGNREENDGCLHVHMLIFNDKYLDHETLEKRWGHGFVKINALENVQNVGAYVCKYITKDNVTEFGRRTFACSNNLSRPKVERFYIEGFSDSTTGLHPETVRESIAERYNSSVTHNYRDRDGYGHTQRVVYSQGTWKDGDIIEKEKDAE